MQRPIDSTPTPQQVWLACTAGAAATLPALLAYNVAPSPTFLNQALALALWGLWLCSAPARLPGRSSWPALGAMTLLVVAAGWAGVSGTNPTSLSLSAAGTLAAAAALAAGGAVAHARQGREHWFEAFSLAFVVAGVLNCGIALIQVFAPSLADGNWVAVSATAGRAVGNLRQPNHLSSLLLWSCIAALALHELGRLSSKTAALLMAGFVFAVVLSASRTGGLSVLMLGAWGLLDRKLSRMGRRLLVATPLVYALSWWAMAQWAAATQATFGGAARLAETDISGSRFGIWKNTLDLIAAHPWAGVGFGEFNLAWTLTAFPGRPTAFFDHTHNLPLQLAVELGLPLASLVMLLLLWALWRAVTLAWRLGGPAGQAQRCAVMMIVMIGMHSLLEYPLWYAYFLLPTAWLLGFALRGEPRAEDTEPGPGITGITGGKGWPALAVGGALLLGAALFSVWDYSRVSVIFAANTGDPPLEERIARGQRSVFFAHHADYAAVTSGVAQADPARAFDRVSHYLLDTRLMTAWAKSLAERGELDAARHIAARLREFNKVDAEELFEPCPTEAVAPAPGLPFQCELPTRAMTWQEFLPKHR
jgi:O-antigen ligase